MSKSTKGMFENAATVSSKSLTGGAVVTYEVAAHPGKDRIVIRDFMSGTLGVIYTRDTPSIKAGSGYIVRNSTATTGSEMGRELGTKGEKFDFPARLVTACKNKVQA